MIRAALIEALAAMTDRDALALVAAVGQWADNQRNYMDEYADDPFDPPTADERAQLATAEAFVEAGELALIATVEVAR